MSDTRDKDKIDDVEFCWGKKRGRGGLKKNVQFYESFTYDGVEYFLYDSVYLFKEDEAIPYVGKLIKIYELPSKARKVSVLWFFHPSEISNYLEGQSVLDNELFLASGDGEGLTNLNPLEAIAGKCYTVCISKDERNRQPSPAELKMADYVFYRTFDVRDMSISDRLDEKIAAVDVQLLLNKKDIQLPDFAKANIGDVAASIEELPVLVEDTNVLNDAVLCNAAIDSSPVNDGDFAKANIGDVAASIEELPVLVEDTNVLNDAVPCNAAIDSSPVNDGEGRNNLLDKFNSHPLEKSGAAEPDSPVPVAGVERQSTSNKIAPRADGVVVQDARLGPLLVKGEIGSKEVGDIAEPHKAAGSADILGTKQTKVNKVVKCAANAKPSGNSANQKPSLGDSIGPSGENTKNRRLNSTVDSGKKSFRDSGASAVLNNGISELGKELQRSVCSTGKVKAVRTSGASEEKPSKKLKLAGASVLRDNGGMSTQETAIASENTSQPAGTAAEINDGGRLAMELVSPSNGLPKKLKSSGMIEDKKASNTQSKASQPVRSMAENIDRCNKQSKDMEKSVIGPNSSNKASQPARSMAENRDKGKFTKELGGTSVQSADKVKSNDVVRKKSNDKLCKASDAQSKDAQSKDMKIEAYGCVTEVTRRPDIDRSNWFTALPWEERIKEAHDRGKLVLLQNLDPAYTSSEVENIVWHSFRESCTAKMVQRVVTSSPHSGQALVIFKTRGAAEKVVRKLDQDCLMLPNGRVLIGRYAVPNFLEKQSPFPGHLVLDKVRLQMQKESREAVSTSHSSQSNTLEYEMALEWGLLQDRSDLWWKKLYKQQGEQTNELKARLKSKRVQAAL